MDARQAGLLATVDGKPPTMRIETICCLDIYGIESQIPSTMGDGSKSWVVISRGLNRHVESYDTLIQITLQEVLN